VRNSTPAAGIDRSTHRSASPTFGYQWRQWLRGLVRTSRLRRGGAPGVRLTLERIEERVVPATITVTSGADGGIGTLRAALANGAGDTIDFAASVRTVTLAGPLPLGGNERLIDDLGSGR
jgi:hypothetical protein